VQTLVIRSRRRRKTVSAREVGGILEVHIPAWMSKSEETHWVLEMQRRVSRRSAPISDKALATRARTLARRYDLPLPESVRWSTRQGRRWGSCTPATGAVRVSSRLAKAPSWVLDYVLVHELAHLEVAAHDSRFHALVARYERMERALGFLDAWGLNEDAPPNRGIVGLDHVQLAMPVGGEAKAEDFYTGILGIPRVDKPEHLAERGGCWFEQPPLRIHLGVEATFRPARKAHPALAVSGLAELVTRLEASGLEVSRAEDLAGVDQAYVDDPFGNRLELIERTFSDGDHSPD
jgi:predicted metal-dependent hydrolase/catechol 2,3-dioxygenase-like lactoylglutathione lyase family enzyme